MKFGICPVQWGSDLNRTEKEVLLAERLGYDQAWFFEHHGSPDSYLGVPLIVISSLAGKTARIHFGAFLPLLFYHPVRLAEEAAVIDRLSRGRLILALGQGYRSDEFSLFRVSRRGRGEQFEEGLEILRRLWSEKTSTFSGRYYGFDQFRLSPRPFRRKGPPLFIAATTPKAIQRAAKLGDAWFPGMLPTFSRLEQMKPFRSKTSAGESKPVPICRDVFVAKTTEAARDQGGRYFLQFQKRHYTELLEGKNRSEIVHREEERTIVGSVDDCIEKIRQYRKAFGITDMICKMHTPGMNPDNAAKSMRLFAKEVMPAFR